MSECPRCPHKTVTVDDEYIAKLTAPREENPEFWICGAPSFPIQGQVQYCDREKGHMAHHCESPAGRSVFSSPWEVSELEFHRAYVKLTAERDRWEQIARDLHWIIVSQTPLESSVPQEILAEYHALHRGGEQ